MNFNEFYRILNWFFQFNSNQTILKNSQKYWKSIWKKKNIPHFNFFKLSLKNKNKVHTSWNWKKRKKRFGCQSTRRRPSRAPLPFRANGADCQSIEWPIQKTGHQSPAIDCIHWPQHSPRPASCYLNRPHRGAIYIGMERVN